MCQREEWLAIGHRWQEQGLIRPVTIGMLLVARQPWFELFGVGWYPGRVWRGLRVE